MNVAQTSVLPKWALYSVLVLAVLLTNALRTALTSRLRRIPGPFLGKISRLYIMRHALKLDFHHLFGDLHRKYGPLVRYGPNKVSVSDPAAIQDIYSVTSKFTKSSFYECFVGENDGVMLDNLFATRNIAWHKSVKSAVAPMYSLTNIRKLERLVDECSAQFMKCMDEQVGQSLDFGTWLQWYAFDVIGNITFAKTFGFLHDKADPRHILQSLETVNIYNTVVGQAPALHSWLLGNSTLMKYLTMKVPEIRKRNPIPIIDKMIADASLELKLESGQQDGTHLEYLNKVKTESPDRLSEADILSVLHLNLFAGSDTTAMSLRAIFYYLVKHPYTYRKLQNEIDEAYKAGRISSVVTFKQESDLLYLQAVIKEAMRMHPGVSYPLERVVPPEGAVICNTFLPGGTIVGVNAWVVHFDQRIYGPDADHFRPERWLDCDPAQLKDMERTFIPFGAGARLCLGKHISMLEMTKFVPAFLLQYNLEWSSSKPEWDIAGFWFARQSEVYMRVSRRNEL